MSGIINSAGSKSGVIGTTELDYEEGTWTATMSGASGGNPGGTSTGHYVKTGKVCQICWKGAALTVNGSSGEFRVLLPFTAGATVGRQGFPIPEWWRWTSDTGTTLIVTGAVDASGTYFAVRILDYNEGGDSTVATTDFTTVSYGNNLGISGSYIIA